MLIGAKKALILPRTKSFYEILCDIGLADCIELCLDAGHYRSWRGETGNVWQDISRESELNFGNGYVVGGGSEAPTFNGVPGGMSAEEYFSFDGDDQFTRNAGSVFTNSLHKDGALFSCVALVYGSGAGSNSIFGNNNTVATNVGCLFRADSSTGTLLFSISNGSTNQNTTSINMGYVAGKWQMVGVTVDEAAGAGDFMVNETFVAHTKTYTSPSAASATFLMDIGARGSGGSNFPAGGRMAKFAFFRKRLAREELTMIFNAIRGSYGI